MLENLIVCLSFPIIVLVTAFAMYISTEAMVPGKRTHKRNIDKRRKSPYHDRKKDTHEEKDEYPDLTTALKLQ